MEDLVIIDFLKKIEDPRIERNKLYALEEVLLVAFATILSGGETYSDMSDFGEAKLEFFKTLLPFKNGIASEDTFARIFNLLQPKAFEVLLVEWSESLRKEEEYRTISIDGKTLRRSGSKSKKPLHMLSVWANSNKLILGCKAVEEKSNEITAVPEVLKLLSLKNTTVTLDAMGCQTATAQQIVDQKGDFVIALKGNQSNLHDDVKTFFELETQKKNPAITYHQTIDKDHGRIEKRHYGLCPDIAWLKQRNPQWSMIKSIGFVSSIRIVNKQQSHEIRYYIVSYKDDVMRFAEDVRGHWSIENSLHWFLDVTCHEDLSRVRNRNAAANLAMLRRLAVSKYQLDSTAKRSKRRKRLLAGWDDSYLKTLLFS
jgi:predicted transposase YbfD/YdcC